MESDYREKWCMFLAAAMIKYGDSSSAIDTADRFLNSLKKRDKEHFFSESEKGYREPQNKL